MAAATRMTGASSATARHGLSQFLITMDEMNAVVDADADERDHREDREEVELDARQREDAGRPDQSDRRRQQGEDRQPPVAKRQHAQAARRSALPIDSPLRNCGRKRAASSLVDQRQSRQRLAADRPR